jgi:hypothetical protein
MCPNIKHDYQTHAACLDMSLYVLSYQRPRLSVAAYLGAPNVNCRSLPAAAVRKWCKLSLLVASGSGVGPRTWTSGQLMKPSRHPRRVVS